jgi:hypothetical protein
MTEAEARTAVGTLALVAEGERAVGRYYLVCAEKNPEHADVWKTIAAAEQRHTEAIGTMAKMIVHANGEGYRIGRRFDPEAVKLFIERVKKNEADARAGAIAGRVLFLVARGLEEAILETQFYELVLSDDPDYRALVEVIAAETHAHQALMNAWAKAADV